MALCMYMYTYGRFHLKLVIGDLLLLICLSQPVTISRNIEKQCTFVLYTLICSHFTGPSTCYNIIWPSIKNNKDPYM